MVFNVFEDHETWSDDQIKLHPEELIVQYILPCFVASFLEFADNTDVEQKDKENYVKIVHELIKGFEVDPYKVAYMEGPFSGGFSPYILISPFLYYVSLWQTELLCNGLQKALGSSPKAIKVADTIDRNFISVLMDYNNTRLNFKNEKYGSALWGNLEVMWRIELHQIFSRILKAIEAAVPGSLPKLMAVEMTVIANICFEDHTDRFVNPNPTTVSLSKISVFDQKRKRGSSSFLSILGCVYFQLH